MATSAIEYGAETTALNETSLRNTVDFAKQAQLLQEQAADDALFRMAQNNAMAQIKGMSKLQEAANQLS